MEVSPLVSIIINNYNYGRFLGDAIESALRQSYLRTEIIVVDDGSTDNSRLVIEDYSSQITAILKTNGGQASALNVGFARSSGAIVFFLDADDMLLPHVVEEVVSSFQRDSKIAKVQFRLATVDESGKSLGMFTPSYQQIMPNGNLVWQVLHFNDDLVWSPTSGNAFASSVLRQIFPMPEADFRICADFYVSNLTALLGHVVSLTEIGGLYRIHAANNYHTDDIDLRSIRQTINITCKTHEYIGKFARSIGYYDYPSDPTHVRAVTFYANRIISLKFGRSEHPIQKDSVLGLLIPAVLASLQRIDLPLHMRTRYLCWFLAIAMAPKPLARWLARIFFDPKARGDLHAILKLRRSNKEFRDNDATVTTDYQHFKRRQSDDSTST